MLKKSLAACSLLVLPLVLTACGVSEVDVDALEESITAEVKEQTDEDAEVTCPDQVDWEKGGTFSCEVEYSDGTTQQTNVEMVDDDGNVEYEFEDAVPAE